MESGLPSEKTKTETELRLSFKRTDAFVTVSKTLIQYAAVVVCMFFVYRCVAALAGKETLASLGMTVLGNLKVSVGICIVLTGGGVIYGLGERSLRRRNIER